MKLITRKVIKIFLTSLMILSTVTFTPIMAEAAVDPHSINPPPQMIGLSLVGRTSTSLTFNAVFPVSGAWGNRIELEDRVTGQWREVGNSFFATNGTYTFSGLVANRTYMGRLTYYQNGWRTIDLHVSTTANASITLAARSSSSLSFNVIYPVSGAWGNRIELQDTVTGQWREAGNSFHVINGTYTFSGLVANRTYMGRLTYYQNGWRTVDLFATTEAAAPTQLPQPGNVRTESVTNNSARILWNSVTNAWGYQVQRLVGNNWQYFGTTRSLYYNVSGLAANTEHRFRVRAQRTAVPNTNTDSQWVEITFRTANVNERQQLAQEILNRYYGRSSTGRRILMPRWSSNMTDANRRSAYMNIRDTANGLRATTRPEQANVYLSTELLRAILYMSNSHNNIQINAIAGGNHGGGSQHYQGRAVDFQSNNHIINGTGLRPAAMLDYLENTRRFRTQRNYRGSQYVGDDRHFHLEIWGRR